MKRGEEFSFGRDLRVRACIVKEKKKSKSEGGGGDGKENMAAHQDPRTALAYS